MINWLPISKRVESVITIMTYNFVNNTCPYYLNENFEFALYCRIGNIKILFERQTWNNEIRDSLKENILDENSLNNFKYFQKALSVFL